MHAKEQHFAAGDVCAELLDCCADQYSYRHRVISRSTSATSWSASKDIYTRCSDVSEWARNHAPILEVCLMRTNYEINCENLALLMPRLFARQVYNFDRCIISHTRVYRHKVYDVTTLQQLYLKHGGSNYCWQNNVTVAPLYIRGAVTPLTSQIVITRRHVSDILNPGGNYIF